MTFAKNLGIPENAINQLKIILRNILNMDSLIKAIDWPINNNNLPKNAGLSAGSVSRVTRSKAVGATKIKKALRSELALDELEGRLQHRKSNKPGTNSFPLGNRRNPRKIRMWGL